jgi:hypothetical protein
MSSKPVVIQLACDLKEAQTNHVGSKWSEILKVYLENMFPKYYPDNQNIGPFKYWFRLSIFQMNYSIDDIDYRLSHGLIIYTISQTQFFLPLPGNSGIRFLAGSFVITNCYYPPRHSECPVTHRPDNRRLQT